MGFGKGSELQKSEHQKSKIRTWKVKNLSKDQNIKSQTFVRGSEHQKSPLK